MRDLGALAASHFFQEWPVAEGRRVSKVEVLFVSARGGLACFLHLGNELEEALRVFVLVVDNHVVELQLHLGDDLKWPLALRQNLINLLVVLLLGEALRALVVRLTFFFWIDLFGARILRQLALDLAVEGALERKEVPRLGVQLFESDCLPEVGRPLKLTRAT